MFHWSCNYLWQKLTQKLERKKKKVSIISKPTIKHCRPTHGTVRKSHRTLRETRHQETNSPFLAKMITKLEMIQSNAYQKQRPNTEIGTSTKQRNIMLSKLGRQCMYFSNEFVILIFQLICSCIYLTMLFYL